jgi:hypothetical protein
VPVSLEDRRLAVVAALRAVAAQPERVAVSVVVEPLVNPMVEAVVGAVDLRLDELSGRLDEVLSRLDSVETTLLEAAWERSTPERDGEPQAGEDASASESETAVSVPALDLAEGRMSSGPAEALFGH